MGSQSVLDFLVAYDLPGIDDNGFSKRKKRYSTVDRQAGWVRVDLLA